MNENLDFYSATPYMLVLGIYKEKCINKLHLLIFSINIMMPLCPFPTDCFTCNIHNICITCVAHLVMWGVCLVTQ